MSTHSWPWNCMEMSGKLYVPAALTIIHRKGGWMNHRAGLNAVVVEITPTLLLEIETPVAVIGLFRLNYSRYSYCWQLRTCLLLFRLLASVTVICEIWYLANRTDYCSIQYNFSCVFNQSHQSLNYCGTQCLISLHFQLQNPLRVLSFNTIY